MTDNQKDYLMDLLTEDQVKEFNEYLNSHPTTTEDLNQTAINSLENAINNCGFNHLEFIKKTNNWHRYLQNELVKLARAIIQNAASDEYRYDGRNEWAHRISKEIITNNPYF